MISSNFDFVDLNVIESLRRFITHKILPGLKHTEELVERKWQWTLYLGSKRE